MWHEQEDKLAIIVANSYDTDISDDDISDDHFSDRERLQNGQVVAAWYPNGEEEIMDEMKVCSVV